MGKRYSSVSDMVKDVSDDKEFQEDLDREISDRRLAKMLFTMRCAQGLTQADMAKRLDCTQSKISKLEHSTPESLNVSDLMKYAMVLSLQMTIGFRKRATAAECVKHHAFEIKKILDDLVELVQDDEDLHKGVTNWHLETLYNLIKIVTDSVSRLLPADVMRKESVLEVCGPTDLPVERAEEEESEHEDVGAQAV